MQIGLASVMAEWMESGFWADDRDLQADGTLEPTFRYLV